MCTARQAIARAKLIRLLEMDVRRWIADYDSMRLNRNLWRALAIIFGLVAFVNTMIASQGGY